MKDLFWYPLFVLFIRWPCKEAKKKAKFIESLFIVQIIVHSHYRAIYNATYRYFMVIGVALLNSSSIQEHQHKDYAHRRSELEKSHEMSANFERRRSPSKTNHNDYFFTLNSNMITFFTVNKAIFVRGLVERQIHVPFCWRHCFPSRLLVPSWRTTYGLLANFVEARWIILRFVFITKNIRNVEARV